MAKAKKTGLGVDALFGTTKTEPGPETAPSDNGEVRQRPPQVRTSILFYEEDFRLLEDLRIRVRRASGKSMSQSEVIREALRRYARHLQEEGPAG